MICHGDELGRTQGGNNNGYCRDNGSPGSTGSGPIPPPAVRRERGRPARRAPGVPQAPVLQRSPGAAAGSEALPDISWFRPDGSEMNDEDWDSGFGKSVAVYLNGQGIPDLDTRGQRVVDDSFVLCFNAHHEVIEFTPPPNEFGPAWQPVVDTAAGPGETGEAAVIKPAARSRRVPGDGGAADLGIAAPRPPLRGNAEPWPVPSPPEDRPWPRDPVNCRLSQSRTGRRQFWPD